jgi:hypothetical protein
MRLPGLLPTKKTKEIYSMQPNELFTEANKIQLLNTEDAIGVQSYPASGAFIDVSGFSKFVFLIGAGALDSALTFQVQQAAAINGTPKDVTGAVVIVAATDDDKWASVCVQCSKLDINNDYRFVTLKATGAAGGNDYAAIFFFGVDPSEKPVTQGSDKATIVSVVG